MATKQERIDGHKQTVQGLLKIAENAGSTEFAFKRSVAQQIRSTEQQIAKITERDRIETNISRLPIRSLEKIVVVYGNSANVDEKASADAARQELTRRGGDRSLDYEV